MRYKKRSSFKLLSLLMAMVVVMGVWPPLAQAARYYSTNPGAVTPSSQADTSITVSFAYTSTNCATGTDVVGTATAQYRVPNSGSYKNGGAAVSCPTTGTSVFLNATGLKPGTKYALRAYVSDSDGVGSCGGSSSGYSNTTTVVTTSYLGLGVSTSAPTTGTVTDTSVVVNCSVDSASDTDNNGTVQYQYYDVGAGGPWTNFGSAVNAKSNTSATVTGLKPGTSYQFRVVWSDSAIYDQSTKNKLTNPYTSTATGSVTTTYQGLGVSTSAPTTGTVTDTSVVVNCSVDSASDTNNNGTVQYQYYDVGAGGPWTNFGSAVTAKSNTSATVTGLKPGTAYQFRVVWTDANGIYDSSTKASLGSPYTSTATGSVTTTYTGLGVGTVTTGTVTADSVVVNAPVDSATPSDSNNNATVQYKYKRAVDGSYTNWGSAVAAKTNQSATITGLQSSTAYNFQVVWTDANGVYDQTTRASLGSPYTSNTANATTSASGPNDTTTGAVSASANASADTAVDVSAAFTGDTNTNGYCKFYYNTTNDFGTATLSSACNNVTGASPRNCTITGLTQNTAYYIWAEYYDPDGVNGGAGPVAVQKSGTVTTANRRVIPNVISATPGSLSVAVNCASQGDSGSGNTVGNVAVDYRDVTLGESYGAHPTACSGAPGTVQSCTINSLNAGDTYEFRVVWTDADGVNTSIAAATQTVQAVPATACDSVVNDCMDCHAMPPSAGDHLVNGHLGAGTRSDCAVCHFDYSRFANVTSNARWTTGHTNAYLDIYTSNNVKNNIFTISPTDKGIKGGYYKGYRNKTSLWDGGAANGNNVCTNTYCHGSNSPKWGVDSSICGSCHGVSTPPGGGKHAAHSNGYIGYANKSNSTNYNFGCYKCHDAGTVNHASGPSSANQAAGVAFDNRTTPKNPSPSSYTPGGSTAGTDGAFNWTNGTCASTYCHSNGNGSNVTNPTWNGARVAKCLGCHGGTSASGTAMATGKHTGHIANGNLGTFNCIQCHKYTVQGNNTGISNKALHVNGAKDVYFQAFGSITGGYDGTSKTCRNVYCHSTGQATPPPRTVTWNDANFTNCDPCHGSEGSALVAGAPEYPNNSTTSRNEFNGHWVGSHVGGDSDCVKCHANTVDAAKAIIAGSKHIDGFRNVSFTQGGDYDTVNKRCSNTNATNCHGSTVVRWGGTLTCKDCHAKSSADVDDWASGGGTATVNFEQYTAVGHGKTSGTYRYGTNAGANLSCTSSDNANTVGGCHRASTAHNYTYNPFRLVSSGSIKPTSPNTLCAATCHTSPTIQNHEKAITAGSKYATWKFTPKCVDCHDPHGDNGGNDTTQRNYKMVQGFVNYTAGSDPYGRPYPSATYPTKAMDFPSQNPRPTNINRTSFATTTFDGICQVCHRRGFGADFSRNTYNMTTHNIGMVCDTCHGHDQGFKGNGDCKSCHATAQNGRPSIQAEFEKKSHHVNATWANVQLTTCAVCHLEGNSDGTKNATYHNNNVSGAFPVDLRVIATVGANEAATVTNNTNSVQFVTGNGTGSTRSAGNVANKHCAGCHNDTNAASNPFTGSEGAGQKTPSAYDPASAGTVFKRYSAATAVKSHPYNTATYNVVPQLNKAWSPHGHPEKNQMKNVITGAWTDDTQTTGNAVGCLDCHNSHGSDAGVGETLKMTTYSSTKGGRFAGLVKQTAAYNPAGTSAYTAISALCFDCHLGDNTAAPRKYSDFGVARKVHEYYDAGRWNTLNVWSSSFTYKMNDNTGKIRGGHFGASGGGLANMSTAVTGQINGSCLACHDPHGTPYGGYIGTGTDRAFMTPALKGTWMSSPYKEDRVADDTGTYTTGNAYDFSNQIAKRGARENPNFGYNNPATIGAGFGGGWSTSDFGKGGTGNGGYFIDDNTFGTQYTYGSGGSPVDVTSTQYKSDAAAVHISQTDTQFGGLCLACHGASALQGLRYSNGTDNSIKVHNTVKGWYAAGNATDLFKRGHSNQHSMGYYMGTGFAGQNDRCSTAYLYFPTGYRWSVKAPLIRIDQAAAGDYADRSSSVANPPASVTGTQSDSAGYKQASFHQFPCAKCHAPHATKLPRLMKTNCLDIGTGKFGATGGNPKHNTGYLFKDCDTASDTQTLKPMVCHGMGPTNSGASNSYGQGGWNKKTGW